MKPDNTVTERAQIAMMLEVCAQTKPGNVDRGHDYDDTWLEHFLASTILVKPAFDRAWQEKSHMGACMKDAVLLTNTHSGGNTHFGAFILLMPLIMGETIAGAEKIIRATTVQDAVDFYEAFAHTAVRVNKTDGMDIHDPKATALLREKGMTLYDVMAYSAENDMVAREWTNGFALTRKAADLMHHAGHGRSAVSNVFLQLLATDPDTFVIKKLGREIADETCRKAQAVLDRTLTIDEMDRWCLATGVNPGSIADIVIAGLFVALGEGWQWDC